MSIVEIPTTDVIRPIVLRVMADRAERAFSDIVDLVGDDLQLDHESRTQTIDSGQSRLSNRTGWACSGFFKAGILERPRRGYYRITEQGLDVAARKLAVYTEKDMLEWEDWRTYQVEVAERRREQVAASSTGEAAVVEPFEATNPIEQISEAVQVANAQTETDLRHALQNSSPEFFERAVIDLLWAMGYGGAHGEKKHVGRSGDGGIDGVISQDALGLRNVYIQAKRYADTNPVSRPEIQQFFGALASQGAEGGVFITTSRFTDGATREAKGYRHRNPIILIDGYRLTRLMLSYGIGVQRTREFTVYEVDDDYFAEAQRS